MRDPHVVSLTYDLVTDDDLVFDAKPLARESPCYRLTLEGEVLSVVMKEHFGTEQSARAVVEEYLRAWEAHAILQPVPRKIRFQYQRGEVVDRNPPPPSPPGAHLMASAHLHGTGSLVATARLIVSK